MFYRLFLIRAEKKKTGATARFFALDLGFLSLLIAHGVLNCSRGFV